ncbi:MAG: divalent-cation tolerance protein CutA [Acidobacteria bacterium]|jgi:periplasmic divalent cation tolerance protein|nr:divalent-cation tolerance protein CutA [Acidobacteriota bacterium]
MTDKRLVFTTAGSEEEARRIANALVARRLAACVNLLPRVTSIFRWQGKVQEEAEWLLSIKTSEAQFPAVKEAIHELHSYEVPECLCLCIEAGSEKYLEWIAESVG